MPSDQITPDTSASAAEADELVAVCARQAESAAAALSTASDSAVDGALRAMAQRLHSAREAILAINAEELDAAASAGLSPALLDRLRLDGRRIDDMAAQLQVLANAPHLQDRVVEVRPDGLTLLERHRPVGVIGANYEARPNVTVDVASQLLKSRNAGVLRTGSAALRSAQALVGQVIAPALAAEGLDPAAVQVVPSTDRAAAYALVRQPELIPLVILRGSGDSTRSLGDEAARHGVRTLAHADGGGVLYIDAAADLEIAHQLVRDSLDRLGVCNRLNLLLIHDEIFPDALPGLLQTLDRLGVAASLPPHSHPRGYEWSLDPERAATVTIDSAAGPADAARIAAQETSGLAAGIVTEDAGSAETFLHTCTGTGVFWNATTRLLDGFRLLRLPETGINIDRVPGPRGPVTFHDLTLRQYVVLPSERLSPSGARDSRSGIGSLQH